MQWSQIKGRAISDGTVIQFSTLSVLANKLNTSFPYSIETLEQLLLFPLYTPSALLCPLPFERERKKGKEKTKFNSVLQ